jgi:hypothetical protein
MESAVGPKGLSLFLPLLLLVPLFVETLNFLDCYVKDIPDSPCRVVGNQSTACISVVVESGIA